nr:archease [Saccharopolyspora hordei]
MPHTADIRFQAWGGTREECLEQAARALVAAFADVAEDAPARTSEVVLGGDDEQVLLAVLDEIVYRLDVEGTVPRDVGVRTTSSGTVLRLSEVDADRVRFTGAAPKAISLHGFSFTHDQRGWRCEITVDV